MNKFKYIVFAAIVISWVIVLVFFRSQSFDAMNALYTLFSGLAFGGLIVTIIQQADQIKSQEKDISNLKDLFKLMTKINVLSSLLNSAQEISRRTSSGSKTDEKEKINNDVSENILKYYTDLVDSYKKIK